MTFRISVANADIRFPCEPGESILDAAERAGYVIPYSCRKGVCETCRCSLDTGSVIVTPSGTSRAAVSSILSCVTVPTADIEITPPSIERRTLPSRVHLRATVHSIDRLSPRVKRLQLRLPIGSRVPFVAGQYVSVLLGEGEARNYSIANPSHRNDEIHLHIGLIPGGLFSDRTLSRLSRGDQIDLEVPFGTFGWSTNDKCPAILLATGTGFAPIRAMLEDLVRSGTRRSVHLFWGGENVADIYEPAKVAEWTRTLPEFRFTAVLANAGGDWDGARGFVQDAVLAEYRDLSGHEVYACGNPMMIAQARTVLVDQRTLDPSAFHADAFVATDANTHAAGYTPNITSLAQPSVGKNI